MPVSWYFFTHSFTKMVSKLFRWLYITNNSNCWISINLFNELNYNIFILNWGWKVIITITSCDSVTLLSNCLKSYASTMIFLATWIWVLCCWVDVLSLLPSSDLYWIRWECCNKWNKSTRYKMHNILFAVVPQYYNNSGVGCIGIHLQFLDFQSSPEKKSFLLLSFSI